MKVKRITTTVRKAREVQGGWYTVELGAEADLTDEESKDWEGHQADLVKLIREDVAHAMMGRRPPPREEVTQSEEGPAKEAQLPEGQEKDHGENGSNPVLAETQA